MGEDNFRKCSKCHCFSEIFQGVINGGTQTLIFFVKSHKFKIILRMENIGQIYNKHKISVKHLIVT